MHVVAKSTALCGVSLALSGKLFILTHNEDIAHLLCFYARYALLSWNTTISYIAYLINSCYTQFRLHSTLGKC